MVGVVGERDRTRRVLLSGAVEAVDHGAAVSTADPFVSCPELESGQFGGPLHGVKGGDSVGTSTPLRGGFWMVVVVMLSTPSVGDLGITDGRNATSPSPSLRVAGFKLHAHDKVSVSQL